MKLTHHAELRRQEFGLEPDDVEAILLDPEVTRPGGTDHGDGRRLHTRQGWTIVVGDDGDTIVTILPQHMEDWTHDTCASDPAGR
jgi:hypothetical protein